MAASASCVKISFEVLYDGYFVKNPLMYLNCEKVTYRDVDVSSLDPKKLLEFIQNQLETTYNDVYYCIPKTELSKGIRYLKTDLDIQEMIQVGIINRGLIRLYTDHLYFPMGDAITSEASKNESESDDDGLDSDDDASVASLDHLSECEGELREIRKKKQRGLSSRRDKDSVFQKLVDSGKMGRDDDVEEDVDEADIKDGDDYQMPLGDDEDFDE